MRAPARHSFVLLAVLAVIAAVIGVVPQTQAAAALDTYRITKIWPQTGPSSGGGLIGILGENLATTTSISIGSDPVAREYWSILQDGSILLQPPAHAPGTVYINLRNDLNQLDARPYEYLGPEIPAPDITSITPGTGGVHGGGIVNINGTGLAAATVEFGDTEVSPEDILENFSTRITLLTPASAAGPTQVTVTTDQGTDTSPFTYYDVPAPKVQSITPSAGPRNGGQTVTIKGTNLWDEAFGVGKPTILIGGGSVSQASITVVDDDTLTAITPKPPPHVEPGQPQDVMVVTPVETGVLARAYSFVFGPIVSSVDPAQGDVAGGTSVKLTGSNFVGVTAVEFGGLPAGQVTVTDGQHLTAVTPAHEAGIVDIVVRAAGGTTVKPEAFTYADQPLPGPVINEIVPSSGSTAGDEMVTITGAGLADATKVWFGDAEAGDVAPVEGGITARTPAHPAGPVAVKVALDDGSVVTKPDGYTYVARQGPHITAVSPTSGPPAGGQTVTITGTDLDGTTAVEFGDVKGTVVSSTSDKVVARTPKHAAGKVGVFVETDHGTAWLADAYAFVAPPPPPQPKPTVTKVVPASGTTAGGQQVTISGTDFTGAKSVTFAGKPASAVKVVNATTLTARTPAHAAGKVAVAVTTAAGTASKAQAYTYIAPPPPRPAKPAVPAGATYAPAASVSKPATAVRWLASTRATGYEVKIGSTTVCQTKQTQCTVKRLVGPKSKVRVRALGAGGTSAWANATWRRGLPNVQLGTVGFGSGRSALTDSTKSQLRVIVRVLVDEGFTKIVVTGHTDKVPGARNPKHGDAIGLARAKAVRKYLNKRLVQAEVTIVVKTRGDRDPIASNKTRKGRADNRRAVITLP